MSAVFKQIVFAAKEQERHADDGCDGWVGFRLIGSYHCRVGVAAIAALGMMLGHH